MSESYAFPDVVVTSPPYEAFSNDQIILCRPNDERLAQIDDGRGHWEQADEGPTFIVLTSLTPAERCKRFAARFALDLSQLLAFCESSETLRRVQ